MQLIQVPSLVGELRSHMMNILAKNNKKKNKTINDYYKILSRIQDAKLPVVYSISLLVIYFIHNSVYLSPKPLIYTLWEYWFFILKFQEIRCIQGNAMTNLDCI